MRLVRLGTETAKVGLDLRAALASWGSTDAVLGGIALLGVTPAGTSTPVEAILLVPRGVLVVVGVDLPDPAIRLEAPLAGQWTTDGWPLVREDGAVNPGGEGLAAAVEVARRLQTSRVEPIPVSTVVAVGPFVEQVVQPTADLHRGVRVLHPRSAPLLTAVRELATYDRVCSVAKAQQLLAVLLGGRVSVTAAQLAEEGFTDPVNGDLATASTTLIPRITDADPVPPERPRAARPPWLRWLPVGALALLGALLLAGIGVAVASSGNGPVPPPAAAPSVTVHGARFVIEDAQTDPECVPHATGDTQVWLGQHQCSGLQRSLYETTANGSPVAVALAVVGFADPATAQAFTGVLNTPGNGSIADLLAEGHPFSGGPSTFDNAALSVATDGSSVRITEVVWIGKVSSPTDAALRAVASTALGLPASP